MKTRYFTIDEIRYRVTSRYTTTNSNYNVVVNVFEVGDTMPIAGTTFKHSDSLEDQVEWAKDMVKEYNEEEKGNNAGTQRSPFGIGS